MGPRMAVTLLVAAAALAVAQPAFADTATFTNPQTIVSTQDADAAPYPSTLDVSGMAGTISGATLTLHQVNNATANLDVLLVSPNLKTVLVMSDVGGEKAPNLELTFDDAAAGSVPGTTVSSGTYKPTDDDTFDGTAPDVFNAPAPAPAYGAAMAALAGDSPNGTWKLFVAEHAAFPIGSPMPDGGVGAGWTLNLTTVVPQQDPPVNNPPPADQTPPADQAPAPNNQPAPKDPNAPQITSAGVIGPIVNGSGTLQVVARDPNSAVTGMIVNFGQPVGIFAESACVQGMAKGRTVTFKLPFHFTSPGDHTVTITILSGGCGHVESSTETIVVHVPGAAAARSVRAHASAKSRVPKRIRSCGPGAATVPNATNLKLINKALLCVMNLQRQKFKLKPLKASKTLAKSALGHTRAMVSGGFFAHQGPTEPALVDRLKKVKYLYGAAENLAAGTGTLATPTAIVNGWLNSPPHRANLLYKGYRAAGLGIIAQFPVPPGGDGASITANFGAK